MQVKRFFLNVIKNTINGSESDLSDSTSQEIFLKLFNSLVFSISDFTLNF